jgi:hypothetical protein
MFENLPTEKEIDRGACIYELYIGTGRAGLSRRNVGLYILARYVKRGREYLRARKMSLRVNEPVFVKEGSNYVVVGKVNRNKTLPLIFAEANAKSMTTFQLKQVSAGKLLTKFHILNSAGDVLGSANIPNAEVSEFRRHWQGPAEDSLQQPRPQQSPVNALAAAFMRNRRPVSKANVLRGCMS